MRRSGSKGKRTDVTKHITSGQTKSTRSITRHDRDFLKSLGIVPDLEADNE